MCDLEEITTEEQYLDYLFKIEKMWEFDLDEVPRELDYFNRLIELVEDYEKKNYCLEYGIG